MANDTFRALAHPLRRDIVERLSGGTATVGEVTRDFGVSKPTISRHLKMLEEVSDWITVQRERWERLFDVVGDYLEERKEKP
jgi:DNA-binding transcriptional ArsR family regulator